MQSKKNSTYRKMLIIRTDRIGDLILSTPAIEGIKKAFPSTHLSIMVTPHTKDIVEGNPFIDEVIIYDKKYRHKSVLATLQFGLSLRKKHFDAVIVFHPTVRAHILAFLTGAPLRIGFARKLRFLLTKKIPHTKQQGLKHEIEYTLDLARTLSSSIQRGCVSMPLCKDALDQAKRLLDLLHIHQKDMVIAMHPGASCPSKKWPLSYFIILAKLLIKKYSAHILFIGDSHVQKALKTASIEDPHMHCVAGTLTLPQTLAVISLSRLLISNDSGPIHMAACVQTPCISLFGRKDPGLSPRRWGPTGAHDVFLHKDVGCSICLAHKCTKGFLCLSSLSPEEVFTAAEKMILLNLDCAVQRFSRPK